MQKVIQGYISICAIRKSVQWSITIITVADLYEKSQSFARVCRPAGGAWLTFALFVAAQKLLLAGLLYDVQNLSTDHRQVLAPSLLQTGVRVHHHGVQHSDGPFKLVHRFMYFTLDNVRHPVTRHGSERKLNKRTKGRQIHLKPLSQIFLVFLLLLGPEQNQTALTLSRSVYGARATVRRSFGKKRRLWTVRFYSEETLRLFF